MSEEDPTNPHNRVADDKIYSTAPFGTISAGSVPSVIKEFKDFKFGEASLTLSDLSIGTEFSFRGDHVKNRITDVGTRTAVFIMLVEKDERDYNGPPYSIPEHVLDEYDLAAIELVKKEEPTA